MKRLPQYLDEVEVAGLGMGLVLDVDLSGDEPTFVVGTYHHGRVRRRAEDITTIKPGPASDPANYEERN